MEQEEGFAVCSLPDGTEVYNVIKYRNINLPCFKNDVIKRLDEFKAEFTSKPGDILIYGYMKSGTHWLREIINMLIKKEAKVCPITNKNESFIEEQSLATVQSLPTPRVISTHLMFTELPETLKNSKIVVPIRNPKDVAVSMFHHLSAEKNGSNLRCEWDRFINEVWYNKELIVYYDWADYTSDTWKMCMESSNAHPVIYEHLLENPFEIVKDLARFLEIDISEELVKDICQECKFSNMKLKKQPSETFLKADFHPEYTMYRKGIKDDWKNHFTEEQQQLFDGKLKKKCEESPSLSNFMLLYSS